VSGWRRRCGSQWPSYLAYLVSFLTIGVIWLNHHRVFDQVARVDGPLLLLNLNLLLWTALIPFPTAVGLPAEPAAQVPFLDRLQAAIAADR
jgi:uncharacterized membrane protein